jgi:hypothetical protein
VATPPGEEASVSGKSTQQKLAVLYGSVNLSGKEPVKLASGAGASLFKKTLLCRTGTFMGAWGPIEITKERLERLSARYNLQRGKPQNENDYAPALINHNRDVELIKGRLMAGLVVAPWTNPETGVEEQGMFGDLRIDRDQDKVESGQYSQVSLGFDEETDEIYEVSFVAVEAARRSQVLGQGDGSMELQKQLDEANGRLQKLSAGVKTRRDARKAIVLAASVAVAPMEADIGALLSLIDAGRKKIKTVMLTSQLRGFVLTGKMPKAEFDGLKIEELADLPEAGLRALLGAYEKRSVSVHVRQFGQAGGGDGKAAIAAGASPAAVREAIALQQSGKKGARLDAGDDDAAKKKAAADAKGGKGDGGDAGETKMEDFDGLLKQLDEIAGPVKKLRDYHGKMTEALGKLTTGEEDDAGAA